MIGLTKILNLIEQLEAIENGRPVLSLTKTSKIVDRASDDLTKVLTKYVKRFNELLFNDKMPIHVLKSQFKDEIRKAIQNTVQTAYFAGTDYTDKALDQSLPIDETDIKAIKQLTDEFETRFWKLIETMTPTVREFAFDVVLRFIARLTSDIGSASVNAGTLDELDAEIPNIDPIARPHTDDSQLAQVEFVTRRDARVCPICEPLDGLIWDFDDTTKPTIPDDTHPNCRCRYLIHTKDGRIIG